MTLKQTSSPAAHHCSWWRCGRAQCGSRIAFMSNTFFGASIHISLPSLVRHLYAYSHDWGVREAAHECKLSPDAVIRCYSRYRSLCAKALDGILIGGESINVVVPYQQTVQTYGEYRRRAANGLSQYSPCFPHAFFRSSPCTNSLSRPSFPIYSPSQAGRDRRRKCEAVRLRETQIRQANSMGGRRCRQEIEGDKMEVVAYRNMLTMNDFARRHMSPGSQTKNDGWKAHGVSNALEEFTDDICEGANASLARRRES
jgi:hypothetical protein